MNNYALMAAPSSDAVAAVHGYRLQVIRPHGRHSAPPKGVELDDDPEAIQRLLSSIDWQRRMRAHELFSPAGR